MNNNGIKWFPYEIGNALKLEKMYFNDNKLGGNIDTPPFPTSFSMLQNLKELHLNNNQITAIPEEVGGLIRLTHLYINSNDVLMSIHEEIGKTALQYLHANHNELTSLPNEITNLTDLKELLFFKNKINQLPSQGMEKLVNLEKLHLHENNALTVLPEGISAWTELKELLLNDNLLETVPNGLKNLVNLTALTLYNNHLITLPQGIGNLTFLTELLLQNNQLQSIPESVSSLTNLTRLHLYNNELTAIPSNIGNLNQLTELPLYNNKITVLPESIDQLVELTMLPLHHNKLQHLPANVGNLTKLTELELQENKITGLPPSIGNLTNLTYLNVDSNELAFVPASIGNLSNLEQFILSNNKIEALPVEIGSLSNVNHFPLFNNLLTSLPNSIGALQGLTEWMLYNNKLTELPSEIIELTNLTKLHLYENELDKLPDYIGNLNKLTEFPLYKNSLTTIPNSIKHFKGLTEWLLYENELIVLPPEIGQLTNLVHLNLNDNRLESIPSNIGQLENLEELFVDKNGLESLYPQIGDLSALKVLSAKRNKLNALPDEIQDLDNLEELYLSSNGFEVIPTGVMDLQSLKTLHLDYNKLNSIAAVAVELQQLEDLNLAHNYFEGFPTELGALTNLTHLDLGNNKIESLFTEEDGTTALKNLAQLVYLKLDTNKIDSFPANAAYFNNLEVLHLNKNRIGYNQAGQAEDDINNIPNLHQLPSLKELYLQNNWLKFNDLEANVASMNLNCPEKPCLCYAPQAPVNLGIKVEPYDEVEENTYIMAVGGKIRDNRYWWYDANDDENPVLLKDGLGEDFYFYTAKRKGIFYAESTNKTVTNPDEPSQNLVLVSTYLEQECTEDMIPTFWAKPNCPEDGSDPLFTIIPDAEHPNYELFIDGNSMGTYEGASDFSLQNAVSVVMLSEISNCPSEAIEVTPIHCNCLTVDSLALVGLYKATNGQNWTRSWDLENNPMYVKDWEGVVLSENGCNVKELRLPDNNLVGTIPFDLGELIGLEVLDISNNKITGLPSEIETCTALTQLNVGNNELKNIPQEMGDLTSMTHLYFNNNELSQIYFDLSNLSNLEVLHLQNNQLDYIPAGVDSTQLKELYVQNNRLIFEDIEPLLEQLNANCESIPCFQYSPQAMIPIYTNEEGNELFVLPSGTEENLKYRWYKINYPNVVEWGEGTNNIFKPVESGTYYAIAEHNLVTDFNYESTALELRSDTAYVFIEPCVTNTPTFEVLKNCPDENSRVLIEVVPDNPNDEYVLTINNAEPLDTGVYEFSINKGQFANVKITSIHTGCESNPKTVAVTTDIELQIDQTCPEIVNGFYQSTLNFKTFRPDNGNSYPSILYINGEAQEEGLETIVLTEGIYEIYAETDKCNTAIQTVAIDEPLPGNPCHISVERSAGTLPHESQVVCYGERIGGETTIESENPILEEGDVLTYVLHTESGETAMGTVLASSNQNANFTWSDLQNPAYNEIYYVSAIVGVDQNNDGEADIEGENTSITTGFSAVFLEEIKLQTRVLCENDETYNIEVSASGGYASYDSNTKYQIEDYNESISPNETIVLGPFESQETVEIQVKDENSCTAMTTVENYDLAIFVGGENLSNGNVNLTVGESIELTAVLTGSESVNYFWTPNTGLNTTNSATTIASPEETTTYTITASIEGGECVISSKITLSISEKPCSELDCEAFTESLVIAQTPVYTNESFEVSVNEFQTNSCYRQTYLVLTENQDVVLPPNNSGQFSGLEKGIYQVCALNYREDVSLDGLANLGELEGCFAKDCLAFEVIHRCEELSNQDLTITANGTPSIGESITIEEGEEVTLSASITGNPATSFIWTAANGEQVGDSNTEVFEPTSTTTYTLEATIEGACLLMGEFTIIVKVTPSQEALPTNCEEALMICDTNSMDFNPSPGIGVDDFAAYTGNSCFSDEHYSGWVKIRIASDVAVDSRLLMTIVPESNEDDYDFAFFGPGVVCGDLGDAIRCSYAEGTGAIGLSDDASETSEGSDGDGFVAPLIVQPGEEYYLLIDSYNEPKGGYTLQWSGEATFSCEEPCQAAAGTVNAPNTLNVCDAAAMENFAVTIAGQNKADNYSTYLLLIDQTDILREIVEVEEATSYTFANLGTEGNYDIYSINFRNTDFSMEELQTGEPMPAIPSGACVKKSKDIDLIVIGIEESSIHLCGQSPNTSNPEITLDASSTENLEICTTWNADTFGKYTYVLTDEEGIVKQMNSNGIFAAADFVAGTSRIYGVSTFEELPVSLQNQNLNDFASQTNCTKLSQNFVQVEKETPPVCTANAGVLNAPNTLNMCDAAAMEDFCVNITSYENGEDYTTLILLFDEAGLLREVVSPSVNTCTYFGNLTEGTYQIYSINFANLAFSMEELEIGKPMPVIEDGMCFNQSERLDLVVKGMTENHSVHVCGDPTIENVEIVLDDNAPILEICTGLISNTFTKYHYILTDTQGKILSPELYEGTFPAASFVEGTCRIYGFAHSEDLANASTGEFIEVFSSQNNCMLLSDNYVTVTKEPSCEANAGQVEAPNLVNLCHDFHVEVKGYNGDEDYRTLLLLFDEEDRLQEKQEVKPAIVQYTFNTLTTVGNYDLYSVNFRKDTFSESLFVIGQPMPSFGGACIKKSKDKDMIVEENAPPPPVSVGFTCLGEGYQLTVQGQGGIFTWYSSPDLDENSFLITGNKLNLEEDHHETYYVTQTIGECESEAFVFDLETAKLKLKSVEVKCAEDWNFAQITGEVLGGVPPYQIKVRAGDEDIYGWTDLQLDGNKFSIQVPSTNVFKYRIEVEDAIGCSRSEKVNSPPCLILAGAMGDIEGHLPDQKLLSFPYRMEVQTVDIKELIEEELQWLPDAHPEVADILSEDLMIVSGVSSVDFDCEEVYMEVNGMKINYLNDKPSQYGYIGRDTITYQVYIEGYPAVLQKSLIVNIEAPTFTLQEPNQTNCSDATFVLDVDARVDDTEINMVEALSMWSYQYKVKDEVWRRASERILLEGGEEYRVDLRIVKPQTSDPVFHGANVEDLYGMTTTPDPVEIDVAIEKYCKGESIELKAVVLGDTENEYSYEWSTGASSPEITMTYDSNNEELYSVKAINNVGCEGVQTTKGGNPIQIEMGDKDTQNCSAELKISGNKPSQIWYDNKEMPFTEMCPNDGSFESFGCNFQLPASMNKTTQVRVADNNGCESSIEVFACEAKIISVVPNPSKGIFNVQLDGISTTSLVSYEVYRPNGQLVMNSGGMLENPLNFEVNLDSNFVGGMYIIRIIVQNSDEEASTVLHKKVVKKY